MFGGHGGGILYNDIYIIQLTSDKDHNIVVSHTCTYTYYMYVRISYSWREGLMCTAIEALLRKESCHIPLF